MFSYAVRSLVLAGCALALASLSIQQVQADSFDGSPTTTPRIGAQSQTYTEGQLVAAGHDFFGQASGGIAGIIEGLLSELGQPNGYILGEEASGAFVGGLRYGEGVLHTQAMGNHQVYWQGPSMGWDFGGTGTRVMMLVYDLPAPNALFQRYTGVDGSAYLIGGAGMTVMAADSTYLVPVRTGVGARLGFSLGYLKFTQRPTWNPF
ncbi:MAG: DUF1134 domain-containing protein [Devosia sp.]